MLSPHHAGLGFNAASIDAPGFSSLVVESLLPIEGWNESIVQDHAQEGTVD